MENGGTFDPIDPRGARSLRTAQRILNSDHSSNTSNSNNNSDTDNQSDTNDQNAEINLIKEQQKQVLEQLKNLSDAIAQISSTQTNVASIRIEQVSEVYFTRQVRPLLDALYFVSVSSWNMAGVASAIQTNTFGERKELRNSLELVYSLNHEIDDIIDAISRRLKIYLTRLKEMDKNCPPFINIKEDS
jgi:hypothetical protein